MSYTVLARKYRPQNFSDVIGQEHVTRTLKNALEQQRIAHGYIFSGHRGIGKTTIARILAMALNCKSSDRPVSEPCGVCDSCREIRDGSVGAMDVIEIDAATNRGIEEVRGLIATATAEPARDRYRIFILDEAHQVTDAAFNALLKTLEEPPSWVVFMMATTQPEDIPQTIRSRCQHFSFHAVKFEEIVSHLRRLSEVEGLTIEDDALALLAEAGDGSMRDALSIMDQAISCCGTTLTADLIRGLIGSVSSDILEQVMQAVHADSSEQVLRIVDRLLTEGHSATHFTQQLVRFMRNAIVAKVAGGETSLLQISADEKARVLRIAELFSEEDLTRFLQILLRTHGDVSYKQEQRFHLELGLLKLVHAKRLLPLEQLLSGAKLQETSTPVAQAPATPRTGTPGGMTSKPAPSRPAPPQLPRPSGNAPSGSPFAPRGGSAPTSRPSPFDSDKARKTELSSEAEASGITTPTPISSAPKAFTPPPPSVFAAKPQPARVIESAPAMIEHGSAIAVSEPQPAPTPIVSESTSIDIEAVRDAVLTAIEGGGWQIAASALDEGEWKVQGVVLNVTVGMSASMIDITFGADQKKVALDAAFKVTGQRMKLTIVSGTPAARASATPRKSAGGGNIRSRAADEPIVKRMQEKFGAETRTVIDQS